LPNNSGAARERGEERKRKAEGGGERDVRGEKEERTIGKELGIVSLE
jgi:hypothetical protein